MAVVSSWGRGIIGGEVNICEGSTGERRQRKLSKSLLVTVWGVPLIARLMLQKHCLPNFCSLNKATEHNPTNNSSSKLSTNPDRWCVRWRLTQASTHRILKQWLAYHSTASNDHLGFEASKGLFHVYMIYHSVSHLHLLWIAPLTFRIVVSSLDN